MLMFIDIVMISTVLYLLLTNRAVSVVSIFCVRVCVCVRGGALVTCHFILYVSIRVKLFKYRYHCSILGCLYHV